MINLVSNDWQIENIETILLDKDGTFIDLHYFWGKMTEMRAYEVINYFNLDKNCLPQICMFLGYNVESKTMLSDGITALYSRVKIIEIFISKLEELGVKATQDEITKIFDDLTYKFNEEIEKYIKPIEDAIDFIKRVRKLGVKIGIVTSDSVKTTELTIKNQKWENLFDIVIGRESTVESKESGIPTKYALKLLGASPNTTVMIGDAPMDSISAQNAGIDKTILVATGQIIAKDLKKSSQYVLKSLKDLKCLNL